MINLNDYSVEELMSLNKMIVDHLNVRQQKESQLKMMKFDIGDKVSFETQQGQIISAKIIRLNQKTVTVVEEYTDKQWRVSPGLISPIVETEVKSSHSVINTPASNIARQDISRNSPCPCGSGKKFKRCCI